MLEILEYYNWHVEQFKVTEVSEECIDRRLATSLKLANQEYY